MADYAPVAARVPIVVLDEVGSTNTEAFARARAGEKGPLWIMARRQTAGRGRAGRTWVSEPGNLYASLLQTFACKRSVVHQLSLLAGVAVIDALRAAASPATLDRLRLKWPNDVLIGEAKLAGVLPESLAGGEDLAVTAAIGIGINLNHHPEGLDRTATHLAAHGAAVAPEVMLGFLAEAMARWIGIWNEGANFAVVRSGWLERAGPTGERLSVHTGERRLEGTFLGLDLDGALRLREDAGVERRLTFGDVALLG
jgi:BirA family biotin operon repressor/biotin-[acetyl-CoA-carboxylase] ligase